MGVAGKTGKLSFSRWLKSFFIFFACCSSVVLGNQIVFANENRSCNPQIYFIGGASDDKSQFVKNFVKQIKPAYEKSGIGVEYHGHWQADDKDKLDKCLRWAVGVSHAFGWVCIVGTSVFAPPLVPWCVVAPAVGHTIGTICAVGMSAPMGRLVESLEAGLKNRKNPIILVGHSWGGDTAYEFATQLLPHMISGSGYEPKYALVTLDAAGDNQNDRRPKLMDGRWMNIHLGTSNPSGCGSHVIGGSSFFGNVLYAWQRNATENINAQEKLDSSVDHCSVSDMILSFTRIY